MDSKTLISRMSMASGESVDSLNAKLEAFAATLCDRAEKLDSVAVPGFGTFQPIKTDEHIVDSGDKRLLIPPRIEVTFKPSVVLRKALGK